MTRKKQNNKMMSDFLFDKVDLIFTAAYGLLTQDYWAAILNDSLTAPQGAFLVTYSLALVAAWGIIGHLRSNGRK